MDAPVLFGDDEKTMLDNEEYLRQITSLNLYRPYDYNFQVRFVSKLIKHMRNLQKLRLSLYLLRSSCDCAREWDDFVSGLISCPQLRILVLHIFTLPCEELVRILMDREELICLHLLDVKIFDKSSMQTLFKSKTFSRLQQFKLHLSDPNHELGSSLVQELENSCLESLSMQNLVLADDSCRSLTDFFLKSDKIRSFGWKSTTSLGDQNLLEILEFLKESRIENLSLEMTCSISIQEKLLSYLKFNSYLSTLRLTFLSSVEGGTFFPEILKLCAPLDSLSILSFQMADLLNAMLPVFKEPHFSLRLLDLGASAKSKVPTGLERVEAAIESVYSLCFLRVAFGFVDIVSAAPKLEHLLLRNCQASVIWSKTLLIHKFLSRKSHEMFETSLLTTIWSYCSSQFPTGAQFVQSIPCLSTKSSSIFPSVCQLS
eukprot:TRINITY_DN7133_c0_g3_i4.p1 TRINITY_DN7133_c0_g3~~TRINITY_DN7133_c0_g3_i4.p1  ORF type:complete len:489 (+),score=122.66 TRINITY_DN7133_c0_g3_i4:181-1467(+)